MSKIRVISLLTFILTFTFAFSQDKIPSKPKLVVGIVVDQMRADYIDRFWNKFGEGGFKRLVNGGTLFTNCNYNYVPTETAPGHASIYTGATPSVNGIIANEWYDVEEKKVRSSVQGGSDSLPKSPNKLLTETITDRFKDAFAGSRVYSISLKDRGAILPGGKKADAAFWYDDATGKFISSRYYNSEKTAAKWVTDFNKNNFPKQFLKKGWQKNEGHQFEYSDSSGYEGLLGKNKKSIFPYMFDSTAYGDLKYTSWGNKITAMFAEQTLINEKLGQTYASDFLCISFSSTDYVGHRFGINSVEIEQVYLDLDAEIEKLLKQFDKYIGQNNYLIFLTADHGAVSNPHYLLAHGETGGIILSGTLKSDLKKLAGDTVGKDSLLLDCSEQIKFNDALIQTRNLNKDSLVDVFKYYLRCYSGIAEVLTAKELSSNKYNYGTGQMMHNGFHPSRNGDIMFVLKPNWINWNYKTGTTHGTPYDYDTHVPLLFYGWKIKTSKSDADVNITDIAPTVSKLLGIDLPDSIGKPIDEMVK